MASQRTPLPLLQVDVVVRRPNGRLEVGPGEVYAADPMLCHHVDGFLGVITVVGVSIRCLHDRLPQTSAANERATTVPTKVVCPGQEVFLCDSCKVISFYSHVDLICRVSAHHVQYREATARVRIDPLAEVQDVALVDDNRLAL